MNGEAGPDDTTPVVPLRLDPVSLGRSDAPPPMPSSSSAAMFVWGRRALLAALSVNALVLDVAWLRARHSAEPNVTTPPPAFPPSAFVAMEASGAPTDPAPSKSACARTAPLVTIEGRASVAAGVGVSIEAHGVAIDFARGPRDTLTALVDPKDGSVLSTARRRASRGRPSASAFRRGGALWIAIGPKLYAIRRAGQLGTPALAPQGDSFIVAWAERADAWSPWRVMWTRWRKGEAPSREPRAIDAAEAMSPGVAALEDGRVLVTWTQGPVAHHDVRAQLFDREGVAIGGPLTLSEPDVNAGQARAAMAAGGRGVVAFFNASGDGYALVAAPIACGGL